MMMNTMKIEKKTNKVASQNTFFQHLLINGVFIMCDDDHSLNMSKKSEYLRTNIQNKI